MCMMFHLTSMFLFCHCAPGLSSLKGFPALIGAKINDAMTLPGEAALPRKDS